MKFFRCNVCGNMVGLIKEGGGELVCCGQPMELLVSGTSDGAVEKHVPAVTVEGNQVHVQVGSVPHPMLPEHYIEWIYLQTKQGGQRKKLGAGMDPVHTFCLVEGDEAVAVYEYCNIHGLWVNEL